MLCWCGAAATTAAVSGPDAACGSVACLGAAGDLADAPPEHCECCCRPADDAAWFRV